jgi:hypothetical protein
MERLEVLGPVAVHALSKFALEVVPILFLSNFLMD